MKLTVRELTNPDIDLVLSYFFKADAETLNQMGVDPGKLPQKADWELMFLSDMHLSVKDKKFYHLIWEQEGRPVGHATIDRISFRREAYMSFYSWDPADFQEDNCIELLQNSVDRFFRVFQLKSLFCVPPSNNRVFCQVLEKVDFKKTETLQEGSGGWISTSQAADLWELSR